MITEPTNIDYLISDLRLKLGDLNPETYRYTDEWLRTALIASVKELQRWWNFKYLVDENNDVYRNSNITFLFDEPPVVQNSDDPVIVIMASIIIRTGSLESSSWDLGSWRDNEISYSNIESGRVKDKLLQRDWDELLSMLTPPTKKLAWSKKGGLPGFKDNPFEVRR